MKVYIPGMSQKIRFLYQILLKMLIFWVNDKKNQFFGKKNWDKLKDIILSLKC